MHRVIQETGGPASARDAALQGVLPEGLPLRGGLSRELTGTYRGCSTQLIEDREKRRLLHS